MTKRTTIDGVDVITLIEQMSDTRVDQLAMALAYDRCIGVGGQVQALLAAWLREAVETRRCKGDR